MSRKPVGITLALSAVVAAFILVFAGPVRATPVASSDISEGWRQILAPIEVKTQGQGKITVASGATLGRAPRVGGVADHRTPTKVRDHRSQNVRDHRACAPYCAWTNPGTPPPLGPSSWPSGQVQ
jgi:hypothetical protein